MEYNVVLTVQAQTQFKQILRYLLDELESQQAATNVVNDFDETIIQLSRVAGSLKLCDDEILHAKGYRTIHFRRHKYLMVYRIDGDKVYVDGIYHDSQDYEHILH